MRSRTPPLQASDRSFLFPRKRPWRVTSVLVVHLAVGGLGHWGASPIHAQVVINEILAANASTLLDDDGDSSDWVELLNLGKATIDMAGFAISDDPGELRRWLLPSFPLEPGGYALVWCSGKDRRSFSPTAVVAADSTVPVFPRWIAADAEWHYLTGPPAEVFPPEGWESQDFDASAWPLGRGSFGFGVDGVGTELPMGIGTVFLRHEFTVADTAEVRELILQVFFDDGVRIFLNGTEVYELNAPADLTFASLAQRLRSPRIRERFNLGQSIDLLSAGRNVLAVALFNARVPSNDLFLKLELGDTETVLHTDFKLRSSGEHVFLSAPDGTLADAVQFPEQITDQSFARAPDGTGPFLYHLEPSPLERNTGPAANNPLATEAPSFSVERGFFEEPLQVELARPAGASLRYTMDGSTPSPTHGEPYVRPLSIDGTTTVRAIAYRAGARFSAVVTHTYLFLPDVIDQPQFETSFTQDPTLRPQIEAALAAAPALMISSSSSLSAEERTVSVELLAADGEEGFQIDAGARYVGGHSLGAYPKKMIRLYFRNRYGGELQYPMFANASFGGAGTDRFEQLQLHSGAHDSIFYLGDLQQTPSNAQYLRNVWVSDSQFEMGHLSLHTRFLHVYLNGQYWGHYHATERPTPSFFAAYLGGSPEQYEATNSGRETVGGETPGWFALRSARRDYGELQRYMDVENYVDYLLLQFYAGNAWDWNPNQNWMAGGPSEPDRGGYKFIAWDSDIIFRNTNDRNIDKGGPDNLLPTLRMYPEFRALLTDRAHALFSSGGLLTPEPVAQRYRSRVDEISRSLPAEPARWQWNRPWRVEAQWRRETERLFGDFFPRRTGIVVQQLRDAGLYPTIDAPRFHPGGGYFEPSDAVFLTGDSGTLYYTLNGADPRAPDDSVHPGAQIYEVPQVTVLEPSSVARVFIPTDGSLGQDWTQPDFDDNTWLEGTAAIGFDVGERFHELIATDLEPLMYRLRSSAYVRIPFDLAEPGSVLRFIASLRYDDGVVLYLNGVEVLALNSPPGTDWESSAERSRPDAAAVAPEALSFPADSLTLRTGRNVLAVHLLNSRSSDQDLLFLPQLAIQPTGQPLSFEATTRVRARSLSDGEWSPLSRAVFTVGTPLVISEIMYNPLPGAGVESPSDALEFVEVRNIGPRAVDLSDVTLTEAVTFAFGDSRLQTIGPGDAVVVVANEQVFTVRHPEVPVEQVAGEFTGKLDNAGEVLRLVGADGTSLFSVAYADDWYRPSDGGGHSLVLADESVPPFDADTKRSWALSRAVGGSPGALDRVSVGRQVPGDVDQNGRLNLADPLVLLRHLFSADAIDLPCGERLGSAGNQALLDANGDGSVNIGDVSHQLRYLFQRGAAPVLGTDCRPIAGCRAGCE
jgi:hypothetical protein